jgi:hypothetical protein
MPCRVAPSPRGMWETRSAVRWDLRMPFPAVGMRMLLNAEIMREEEGKCHLE